MRVLFDQNVPRDLRKHLPGHEIQTAANNMEWDKLENGLLLHAAETAGFDVFITGDQNLRYQQNLAKREIAIVELTKNNWPSVEPHAAKIAQLVNGSEPGAYHTVHCPYVLSRRRP